MWVKKRVKKKAPITSAFNQETTPESTKTNYETYYLDL